MPGQPPLRTYPPPPALDGLQPAGDRDTQMHFDRMAREMIETYRIRPGAPPWTRLAPSWLRRQGWQVLLLPKQIPEEADEHLAGTLRALGHHTLLGATAEPDPAPPAAVFRFPATAEEMVNFRLAHTGFLTLTFPEDRSMVLHYDSENITLAGPAGFLREAVPGREALRAALAEDNRHLSAMHGNDYNGPLERHYAAFALRD